MTAKCVGRSDRLAEPQICKVAMRRPDQAEILAVAIDGLPNTLFTEQRIDRITKGCQVQLAYDLPLFLAEEQLYIAAA